MPFELTESLIDDIVFAMENQDKDFFFDAKGKCVVSPDSPGFSGTDGLEENDSLYSLPHWSSKDGFDILEDFAGIVRAREAHDGLLQVLSNGRGVFRNYKNVLSRYPHIEKQFHAFKRKKMRAVVMEWYNSLRESWGLEKLSQDFEEYDELTQEDFEFHRYNHQKDGDCVFTEAEKIAEEIKAEFKGDTGLAMAHFWLRKFYREKPADFGGVVCRTLSDGFAACLLFYGCGSFAKNTVALTAVFVNQNYRGLGIARELFSRGISQIKEQGIHSIIIVDSVIPDYLEPLLARCGFEKKGSAYVLELTDKKQPVYKS